VNPDQLAVAIAGYGLYPSGSRLADRPLGTGEWAALCAILEQRLLLGLGFHAAETGALPVTNEQRDDLAALTAKAQTHRAAVDDCLVEVIGALDRRGIDSCVLQGAAAAALDYRPSTLRLYDSLHLLVGPEVLTRAVSSLREDGLLCSDGLRRWSRRQRTRACRTHDGIHIFLHSSLTAKGLSGSVGTRELFANRVRFSTGGTSLAALGTEERLIAACVRARPDGAERDLVAQRDVTQLVLRDDLSVPKVARLASSWRLEALLADAVRRAWDTFAVPDVVALSAWSRSYRPRRRDRKRLTGHRSHEAAGS
jgi:Uncharacterised nucleotidyltransferase